MVLLRVKNFKLLETPGVVLSKLIVPTSPIPSIDNSELLFPPLNFPSPIMVL